ncbi:hypothetical protein A4X13_0g966 [Tilletia indica]|uniref:Uncharacterized protein n=1 Tax=Tilletia indica TaxID=43049 RepID=A0A177TIL7_9BASI|nr:hypothetical protein A4X13_0g966 [Tilletia indica]
MMPTPPSSSRSSTSLPLPPHRSSSTSAVRSTFTPSASRVSSTEAPRLPSISTWFPSAAGQPFSSSHLSTPLNKLKIAQPILPSSPNLKPSGWPTKRPVFLGLECAFSPPNPSVAQSSPTMLPVAVQVPSQARVEARRRSAASIVDSDSYANPLLASNSFVENDASDEVDSARAPSVTSSASMRSSAAQNKATRRTRSVVAREKTGSGSSFSKPSTLTAPAIIQGCSNNIFATSQAQQHAECFVNGRPVNVKIEATSRDCFSKVAGKFTTYRRNYLKIDALVHVAQTSPGDGSGPDRTGQARPITSTERKRPSPEPSSLPVFATLTAHVAETSNNATSPRARLQSKHMKDNQVSLVQFGPERERGERRPVEPQRLVVDISPTPRNVSGHGLDRECDGMDAVDSRRQRWHQHPPSIDDEQDDIEGKLVTFRRIQIRRATTNNGRLGDDNRSEQQYFVLRISIYAAADQDESFSDQDGASPPPLKRTRRSLSGESSTNGGHTSSMPTSSTSAHMMNDKATAPVLGKLLATLDSAPVTIRGRSRKHFAAAASDST